MGSAANDGRRALSSRGRAWAVAVAAVVALLVSAPAALATSPGTDDAGYGNAAPYGIVQGPSGTTYVPGGVAALPDGSLLVADDSDFGVTRLTAAGAPDPSFGASGTVSLTESQVDNSSADAVTVAPDGSYVVAGSVGGNSDFAVARFTTAGALDTSFASSSSIPGLYRFNNDPVQGTQASSSTAHDVAVASDGTILAIGTEDIGSPSEPALILDRITSSGSGEERFSMQADDQPTTGEAVALAPDGSIYVLGVENAGTASARTVVARVQRSGSPAALRLDPTFNPGGTTPGILTTALGGTSGAADAMAVAPDGDILIAGEATGSTEQGVVARLTPSGAFDQSFGSGGVATLSTTPSQAPLTNVTAIALEPNGAPVLAGDSAHSNPTSGQLFAPDVTFVAHLTTTGQLDPGFDAGGRPGLVYQSAQTTSPSGYDDGEMTGLAIDFLGRLVIATDTFSTGSSTPDEAIIERLLGYAPPVASFSSPAAVVAGVPATFDATGSSDPVGSITDYAWDFDGSSTFQTDGGSAPTIQHTFTTTGTVSVSLRVTNAAGRTSMESVPVTVLAASHVVTPPGPASGPVPRVSLSATSLSFSANINDFDSLETDTPPQTIYVTNAGNAPLTISRAEVINSIGGFAISNRCISILGSDGTYSGGCLPTNTPADTCTGATLSPGSQCSVKLQYQDGGQYPAATGALAIISNAGSSPNLVTLKAKATIVSSTGGAGASRCPAIIGSGALALAACWTDVTNTDEPSPRDTWASFGPVTINDQVTLVPTASDDELFASNGTLSATPAGAKYTVEVSNSSAPPSVPIGELALGKTALACTPGDENGCGPAIAVSPAGFSYHGLTITGASIIFYGGGQLPGGGTACRAAFTDVFARLPQRVFTTEPDPSAKAPTVDLEFGGCTNAQAPTGLGPAGGGSNMATCPKERIPTPGCSGTAVVPDQPHARRRSDHLNADAARAAHDDGGAASACPDGDEDFTDTVPAAFVGAMQFGGPYLCYDPASQVWTAGGTISVLGATVDTGPPPDYGISFDSHGNFVGGGIKDITTAIPIAPGVLLTDFGGGFHLNPTRIGLQATVQAGGIVTITGGGFAVWADPHDPFTYDPTTPYSIPGVNDLQTNTTTDPITDFAAGAGGTLGIQVPGFGEVDLAKAYVFYAAPSYFEFGGAIGIPTADLDPGGGCSGWCVNGSVLGAFDTGNRQYDIEGGIQACADFPFAGQECVSLDGLVSNHGLGVCGGLGPVTGGFTYDWGGGLNFFAGLGVSCHDQLGPVRVVVMRSRSLHPDVARVAAASGAVTLKLPGGAAGTSIYVKGDGAPPGLTLTGPGGRTLSEPGTGRGISHNGLVIWPEPQFDETVIELSHPPAGQWTITPLAGSPAISSVSDAELVAPPPITTAVTGTGTARTLSYHVRGLNGRHVTFAERAGRVLHPLGAAHGATGSLRFTPAPGPAGKRRIVAVISFASGPASTVTVGHYTAPAPAVGRPSRVRISRHGNALRMTWAAASGASRYLAVVSLSDGRDVTYTAPAGRRVVTVPMVAGDAAGHVTVMAVGPSGLMGRGAAGRLGREPAPASVRGLEARRTQRGVLVTWHRDHNARLYILRLAVHGAPAFAPEFLTAPRFVSVTTLPRLKRGRTAVITVTAVGTDGQAGRGRTLRYRAPRRRT